MKNALIINGSPRMNGNNAFIIDIAVKMLNQENDISISRIEVSENQLAPCTYCRSCEINKGCIINDDMQEIYDKLNRSEIFVVSCPLYFNGVSAQFKALVDRCQAIWASKYVLSDSMIVREKERKGLFVCTSGTSADKVSYDGAISVAHMFFRVINVRKHEHILIGDVDANPVADNDYAIKQIIDGIGKLLE